MWTAKKVAFEEPMLQHGALQQGGGGEVYEIYLLEEEGQQQQQNFERVQRLKEGRANETR